LPEKHSFLIFFKFFFNFFFKILKRDLNLNLLKKTRNEGIPEFLKKLYWMGITGKFKFISNFKFLNFF
jgi:hypothetical protein